MDRFFFENPNFVLSNNGPQFGPEFFAALCTSLERELVTTTKYHLQVNGQLERYSKTLVARLQQYITKHYVDCDLLLVLTVYEYNT